MSSSSHESAGRSTLSLRTMLRVEVPSVAMRCAMERGGRLISETLCPAESRWALGRIHLNVLNPFRQLESGRALNIVFHGDLQNAAELWDLTGGKGNNQRERCGRANAKPIWPIWPGTGVAAQWGVLCGGSRCGRLNLPQLPVPHTRSPREIRCQIPLRRLPRGFDSP